MVGDLGNTRQILKCTRGIACKGGCKIFPEQEGEKYRYGIIYKEDPRMHE
jgi:hypothetical protein